MFMHLRVFRIGPKLNMKIVFVTFQLLISKARLLHAVELSTHAPKQSIQTK